MSKQQNVIFTRLAFLGLPLLMAGCSQLTQPPAPIETGNSRQTAPVAIAVPRAPVAQPAVTRPLRAAPIIRADAAEKTGPAASNGKEITHVVAPGENLYRIALNSGLKYQDLANWNQLPGDYSIKVGQVLRLTPPDSGEPPRKAPVVVATTPAAPVPAQKTKPEPTGEANETGALGHGESKPYPKALKLPYSANAAKELAALSEGQNPAPTVEAKAPAAPAKGDGSETAKNNTVPDASGAATAAPKWIWPTQGKLLEGFSDSNKGLDIAGKLGQAVIAVADGNVVYSGAGLRGYGKLIIIKHDKTYLTAYAHNSQILVKEGQSVKKGQKIAEMGNTDSERVKLHFEVRRFGKPVDPTQYLDKQS